MVLRGSVAGAAAVTRNCLSCAHGTPEDMPVPAFVVCRKLPETLQIETREAYCDDVAQIETPRDFCCSLWKERTEQTEEA